MSGTHPRTWLNCLVCETKPIQNKGCKCPYYTCPRLECLDSECSHHGDPCSITGIDSDFCDCSEHYIKKSRTKS